MSEEMPKPSLRDRIRWWIYEKCFAYCVRSVFPDADPAEFSLLDNASFIAISKDEIREIMEEAPDVAWHFDIEMQFYGR
jgi:hypothetical protein